MTLRDFCLELKDEEDFRKFMKIFEQKNIKVNLPVLIDSRMLLCANSGGGKSYTIRKILESAGTSVMSIILDVEGEFKTLREKFDYLLIGQAGDVPINIKAAHLLPAKLLELNISTIIDISDLKRHDRILYVKIFLETLMELPRKFWKPCLIIVDEAHAYCGQQEKQESTHAVIDLMTRGRKRGFCGILATQRIAKLHKDAAAEANNYMVGRTGLDVDMKRAAELLGFTSKADMLSLRNLDPGEFYVFGTAISRGVEKVKVTKVKTTHPKVGMDLRGKITPPTERIKSLLSKLNDLPKEAEEKAKTLEELKKRNRELEHELKKRPDAKLDERQIEIIRKQGFDQASKQYYKDITGLNKQIKSLNSKLKKIAEMASAEIKTIPISVSQAQSREAPPVISQRKIQKPKQTRNIRSLPAGEPIEIDSDIKLNKCERRILSLFYNNPQRSFKKHLAGIFTGYSHKSGGFNNAIAHLSSLRLIVRNSGDIQLSTEGELAAPELLGDDINLYETFTIDNWANVLPKCDSTIFQFLMQNPEIEFSKDDLGEATNYKSGSGGFNNAIAHLNALKLIKRVSGRIKLNEEILEL